MARKASKTARKAARTRTARKAAAGKKAGKTRQTGGATRATTTRTTKRPHPTGTTKTAEAPARTMARGRLQASDAECFNRPDAEALVLGIAGNFDIDTQLRDIFPAASARDVFCQRVAEQAGFPRTRIPCGGTTTLDAVIAAISC